VDLFEKVDKKTLEITQSQYNKYLNKKPAQDLGTIEFTQDTSYQAFHDLAWKELTMEKKIIAVLWFNKLIAKENDRPSTLIVIDGNYANMMEYVYVEKKDAFGIVINPFLLSDSKQYFGGFVMHNLMQLNMKDNLKHAIDSLRGLCFDYKYDVMTLANFIKPLEKPDYLSAYNYELVSLGDEQKKEALLYLTQPAEDAFRKSFELTCEYMQQAQEIIEVPDDVWDSYENMTKDLNKFVDEQAEMFFKKGEKEEFFKLYLKQELKDINFYIKHQEKER
jgi:hypothetical protein